MGSKTHSKKRITPHMLHPQEIANEALLIKVACLMSEGVELKPRKPEGGVNG